MANTLWSWAGFGAAFVIGAGLGFGHTDIITAIAATGFGPRFLGAPLSNPVFLTSVILSVSILVWLFIGWVLPLLNLGITAGKALASGLDLNASQSQKILGLVYGKDIEGSDVPLPAPSSLPSSGKLVLEINQGRWFYQKLPLAGFMAVMLAAFYAATQGAVNDLSRLGNSLAAVERAADTGMALGMTCFLVGALFAFLGAVLFWLADGFARTRLDQVLAQSQVHAPSHDMEHLEACIREALQPSMATLSAASERLADNHAQSTHDLLAATLDKFVEQLSKASGARFSAIEEALTALDKAATATLTSVKKAQEQLGKTTEQQVKSLGDGYTSSLQTMQKQQSKHTAKAIDEMRSLADFLQAMVQKAIQGIQEQVDQSRSVHEALLTALGRATTASATGQVLHDAAQAHPDTVRRLSSAIRDLKKAASEPMPDL